MSSLKYRSPPNKRLKTAVSGFLIPIIMFFHILLWGCVPRLIHQSGQHSEPKIRVCLAENIQTGTLVFEGNFLLKLEEAHYRFNQNTGKLKVFLEGKRLILKSKKRYFEFTRKQKLLFQPQLATGQFKWNSVPYKGQLFIYFAKGAFTVINMLPLENYLKGVVPFEMPTGRSEYKEALFAQAVAARSYAINRIKSSTNRSYDVRPDTRDQVYKGALKNPALSEKAILSTRGIVLMYQGQPALTLYHSTSGGTLERDLSMGAANKSSFAYDAIDKNDNDKVSPLYRWVEIREAKMILKNLKDEFKLDAQHLQKWLRKGFLMKIEVIKRKPSGRVAEMKITVDDRHFLVKKGLQIRRILANKSGKILPSALFFINMSPSNPEKFYIIGAGAGHGKGMSQWGAIGMALKGYPYHKILKFYYPNFALHKYY